MTATNSVIHVDRLSRTYNVPMREGGLLAAARSLFRPSVRAVEAVRAISFTIEPGEIVGFLGPNGAGKTTTLKMLSGLLYPSGGVVEVLGHQPWRRDRAFLRQISLVMGQRSQLIWDIPVIDSFTYLRTLYAVPNDIHQSMLGELSDLLQLEPLLRKPVRNLSLGERMKCEMAAALLHRPALLFLDEPTIGMDITMQRALREFIQIYNQRFNATVLLTSHYLADVEALCRRVLIIHRGALLYDGSLKALLERFAPHKTIIIQSADGIGDLTRFGSIVEQTHGRVALRVPKTEVAHITRQLLLDLPVADLSVVDSPIDEVIEQVFAREAV